MKVIGRTFENKKIVQSVCKNITGDLDYKLGLLGFMPQFAFGLSVGFC